MYQVNLIEHDEYLLHQLLMDSCIKLITILRNALLTFLNYRQTIGFDDCVKCSLSVAYKCSKAAFINLHESDESQRQSSGWYKNFLENQFRCCHACKK